jgi:hypothetical protein
MTDKTFNNDDRFATLKNEAARQRWVLFHQAIAVAKQSNAEAMEEAERARRDTLAGVADGVRQRAEPILSIAR